MRVISKSQTIFLGQLLGFLGQPLVCDDSMLLTWSKQNRLHRSQYIDVLKLLFFQCIFESDAFCS